MTTILTGANRGLGYETALALAANTTRPIVLAGRDMESLKAVSQRIHTETGHNHLTPMQINLADLASVRAFVAAFHARDLPPLDLLICNAGISRPDVQARSADGYELTFAVNHLAHFLLVNLLLGDMRAPAQIWIVSSGVHDMQNIRGPMQPPHYEKAAWLAHPEHDPYLPNDAEAAGGRAYATSKLCNVLHTYELARRLERSGLHTAERPLTVNAFDPGLMAGTGLGRHSTGWTRIMWYRIMPLMSRLLGFGRTAARSGADLAHLATSPELATVTGKYFSGRKLLPSSNDSYDAAKAADLWQTSVELSGLQPDETALPLQESS